MILLLITSVIGCALSLFCIQFFGLRARAAFATGSTGDQKDTEITEYLRDLWQASGPYKGALRIRQRSFVRLHNWECAFCATAIITGFSTVILLMCCMRS